MYLAAGMAVIFYLLLWFLSRKQDVEGMAAGIQKPFYKMALYLYKKMCIRRLPISRNQQVQKDLERLHPGENRERICMEYHVKKLALCLLICLAGTFLATGVCFQSRSGGEVNSQGEIQRGSYLDAAKEITVEASLKELGEKRTFHITVEKQKLKREEAEALYDMFWKEVSEKIPGENGSLMEITKDLQLVEMLQGYPFLIEWKSNRPELISSSGKVEMVEKKEQCTLTATVTYEDMEWQQEILVCVIPPVFSQEEQRYRELEQMLYQSEMENREDFTWKLPETYAGQPITWRQPDRDNSLLLWTGALLAAVLVYFLSDKDLHDNLETKKTYMKKEYPDIVQKLMLYMGAGMTIRGAFQKVAGDYEREKAKGGKEHPACEEMLYTCRELRAGISEGAAYEHFGKRTGLQEYIRLCTLLQQNLKKGNSTLLLRLREEAERSNLERVQSSRRKGEEASTKLLVPMVMMLLVVMVMIMLPAFSSATM